MDRARKLIMLVDDNRTNLLTGKTALSVDYTVLTIPSAAKMFETLEWSQPELILLDVDMPEMNGFEAIKLLKNHTGLKEIPVIFLTAMNDSDSELEGLQLGALDYIIKPFSPPLLRKRVELHLLLESQRRKLRDYNDNLEEMVEAQTKTITKLQNKIMSALAEMVEGRDGVTGEHITNTQKYLRLILNSIDGSGLWKDEVIQWKFNLLIQSSQLHDIGKIAISDSILKKNSHLTVEEFNEMKKHVEYGLKFIEDLEDDEDDSEYLKYSKIFIAYHHEKWDGSGYPKGLAGENIPLLGRAMAIADVYDALTSVRPYKKAFSHEEAWAIIQEGKGKHFDPELVELLDKFSDKFKRENKPNKVISHVF